MKLREIFRFELAYQIRRPWPWLAFAVLVVFSFENTRVGMLPVTLSQDFILNSPFIITVVTVFSCLVWLLVASAMAGEAAARDVQTGMYPLTFTTSVSKAEYLSGRFLAAFLLNALVLLGVQMGSFLGVYAGGVSPEIIGPFRPAAYLAAYAFIALPNAFTATTVQFAAALLSGRPMASYVGSMGLFVFTFPVPVFLYFGLGQPELALLMDPIGMFAIMNEMMTEWTMVEKNVRMFTLEGPMLANRLLWLGISVATLAFIYARFRLAHRTASALWSRLRRRFAAVPPTPDEPSPARPEMVVPQVPLSFGFAMHVRQTLALARSSFKAVAMSLAGIFLLVAYPLFAVLVLMVESEHWGVGLLPRTGYILAKHLTAPLTYFSDFRVVVPLLIVYFAGELVWRERDAGLGESVDATSVPEWALFARQVSGPRPGAHGVHGEPDGGRDARADDPGLPRLRDRPVPEDSPRAPTPRVPAFRRARLRGAHGGRPEARGPAHRARGVPLNRLLLRARHRAQPVHLRSRSGVVFYGHAWLRRVLGAVAVVQALLGGVGARTGGGGAAALGARARAWFKDAAARCAAAFHAHDGQRRRHRRGPHPHPRRLRLLQHERAQRVRHRG